MGCSEEPRLPHTPWHAGSRSNPRQWISWLCAALSLAILAAQVPTLVRAAGMPDWNGYGATDYELYMAATRRWLEAGVFYHPEQLVSPYTVQVGHVLYPPVALWLFVPFTFLPAVLWWAIPIGVSAWVIWILRPGPIAWPIMALCLWGPVQIHFVSGNPGLWAMMFLALATRWPFFGPFVAFKATFGPLGLWGNRHRAWWTGLAVLSAMSLAVLPMWSDWIRVLINSRGSGGLLYSWQEAPLMLIPIIAWLARPGGRYGAVAKGIGDRRDDQAERLILLAGLRSWPWRLKRFRTPLDTVGSTSPDS